MRVYQYMSEDSNPVDHKNDSPGAEGGLSSSPAPTDPAGMSKFTNGAASPKYWEVLLVEFVHQVGLFLVHSRHAQGARSTDALFEQLVRHLGILMKMPDHEGGILIRRSHCKAPMAPMDADYLAMCGNLMVKTTEAATSQAVPSVQRSSHLESALAQAFRCFADLGIHSLYIRMPGPSAHKIDQLRLAMNIVARFRMAVNDATSIRFRCYGRALTFPLINDAHGDPDPNLTLMAALNGLSPVNAKELIKQAEAYHSLNAPKIGNDKSIDCISSYNQIFAVRSLRSQIIKPPVEVNNLPWLQVGSLSLERSTCQLNQLPDQNGTGSDTPGDSEQGKIQSVEGAQSNLDEEQSFRELKASISKFIDIENKKNKAAFAVLTANDYAGSDPQTIGARLVSLTELLYALDKRCQDPSVFEKLIDFFRQRLQDVQDIVLSNIITQRQGLKIVDKGRAIMVGLVHPRLFDLITLMSEQVAARRRMAIIEAIAFNFDPCHMADLSNGFCITENEAHQILKILKDCFSAIGSFIRPTFEGRIDLMVRYENAIFEILWCFLKKTPRSQDRLNFLNALQLLMAKLRNPKRATQFLLADICQTPSQVHYTDRNAFTLGNILLHQENKELYVDINRTPENALNLHRRINSEVRQYLIWRLEVDKIRMLSKLRTIHRTLQEALLVPVGAKVPYEVSFLLALEREALIFLALVGGHTARTFLREVFNDFSTAESEIYQHDSSIKHRSDLLAQLQIVIRSLGRAGNIEDIEKLRAIQDREKALCNLDSHPAHTLKVKQLMKWIPEAIKRIHAQK